MVQAFEYIEASFTIADSVYGSAFFVATGFHGLHVLIGTLFLIVCLFRLINNHYTKHHHNGFEAAI
jgi:heme/copper-type cytochrome/quinol oxidase subunit 3